MSALRELADVAKPLLRLVNRRFGAYSHGLHATRIRPRQSYLLLERHYSRQPRQTNGPTIGGRYTRRHFHDTPVSLRNPNLPPAQEPPPQAGPKKGGNDPNEVFTDMNILSGVPPPASAIETVYDDGFLLNNGMKFHGKDGIVIVHNEAFNWLTDGAVRVVRNSVLELDEELLGVLDVVAPKPELLILGTGARSLQISARTKDHLHNLGIRIDSMDTRNAASSYNLLATERPGQIVAAALLPASFR
ncbi:hypothetical protein DRE_01439 [Drechslerella stenobrocha 248]|uniref:NADH dehydrogenase [ubiquinone] 1 alpha subcomplex assembly factor 3 n=1 Tax=Drechslerella stenobrocha 248 TaxID=1043628 RepID=W7HU18_9PEZI|nr:hypothetical protein DRE_01439 [Drechslerella stenobrocha 248]